MPGPSTSPVSDIKKAENALGTRLVLHNKGKRTDYVGLPEKEEDLYIEAIDKLVKKGVLSQAHVNILLLSDSDTFDAILIIFLITSFTYHHPKTDGEGS